MTNKNITKLVRRNIRKLCPYSTARDEYQGKLGIFLDANESPYGNGYNRYPDPRQLALKQRLSEIKGLPVENIFLGNGSDEAIDLLFRVFCNPGKDNAVVISPSYGMYTVAADINNVEVRSVALKEDFALPVEEIIAACDSKTKLVFLCSPNNPSGNAFGKEELLKIVDSVEAVVVVDEAYADFSSKGSLLSAVLTRPNLVVLQTLSKAWGLAGLRLGIAYAQEYIIRVMSMVKYPYNINQATQDLVMMALKAPIANLVEEIVEQRKLIAAQLEEFPFVQKVYPSDANFLLVKVDDADALYNHLIDNGIIVRNRNKVAGCAGCVRITIGLPEENAKLIESLKNYL